MNLAKLQEKCKDYQNSKVYVYKSCRDESNDTSNKQCDDRFLIVMKKIKGTITNEKRELGQHDDKQYALHTANKLLIVDIINLKNHSRNKQHIFSSSFGRKLSYKIGKITTCGEATVILDGGVGMPYFKTIERAYYSSKNNGIYKEWNLQGEKKSEGNYAHGKRVGLWTYFYPNKQIKSEGNYAHGKEVGLWTYFYPNKQIRSEGNDTYGKQVGLWTEFTKNGQIKRKGEDENKGNKVGVWTILHDEVN